MFPIRDHNPSDRIPVVTYGLMAINILIWLYGTAAYPSEAHLWQLYQSYGMVPLRIVSGAQYETLLTSIFLHSGIMHLAGNMLFLWIFGDNVEDKMGAVPFLIFYLACGAAGNLAQLAADPFSRIPTVGASGAIAGVMGGYLLLFPRARVDILIILIIIFRILPIPAWIMLGLWFGFQLFNSLYAGAAAGVAYWAHSGGFFVGLVLMIPLWLRLGGPGFWARTEGHPDHPAARYPLIETRIPRVPRK